MTTQQLLVLLSVFVLDDINRVLSQMLARSTAIVNEQTSALVTALLAGGDGIAQQAALHAATNLRDQVLGAIAVVNPPVVP